MESQLQGPSSHGHHEQDPQYSVIEDEGEDEHKSVLKKVKDKAKKIKDKISKHGHGGHRGPNTHDHREEDNVSDQAARDPQVHDDAPVYKTCVIRSTDLPTKTTTQNVTNEDLPVGPGPMAPEPRGPMDMEARKPIEETKMKAGAPMGLEMDPHSPHDNGSPSNYPTGPGDAPGNKDRAEVSPLVGQFGELSVGESDGRPESENKSPRAATHDRFTPEKTPIETQAHSQEKTQDHDSAVSAKDVLVSKLGFYGGGPHEGGGQSLSEVVSEYSEKVAEKLRPGDEDRALSEVVTGALAGKREEGGSRVRQSPEVTARLGPAGEKKREGEDALTAGAESSGKGVVERVKDAAGLWLGMSGGVQTAQESAAKGFHSVGVEKKVGKLSDRRMG